MRLVWSENAWQDYLYWQGTDAAMVAKINDLIRDAKRQPFKGIGKPEPLRGALQGWWSRRITGEHRLVYQVRGTGEAQALEIIQCRLHY